MSDTFDRRLKLVEQAVEEYQVFLLGFAGRLCGHDEEAKDIVQQLWRWVILHAKEDAIGDIGLLCWKVRNLHYDRLRKTRAEREAGVGQIPESAKAPEHAEAGNEAEEKAMRERFWEQFPGIELSDDQREALWLLARYGYTYDEIAALLAVPRSTIGDWIKLARQRIREHLDREDGEA